MSVSAPPPTTTRSNAAAPSWSDVVGSEMWLYGRAECGCATYQHVDHEADEYAGDAPLLATLHDAETCSAGLSVAHIPVEMRAAMRGIAVPAGVPVLAVDPAMLAATLRELPAADGDAALVAVAAEREAESDHAAVGVAAVEEYLARWAAAEDEESIDTANRVTYTHLPIDGDPAAEWFAAALNPLDPQGEYPGDDMRRRAEARVRHESALVGEVATPETIAARYAAVEAALATAEAMAPVTKIATPEPVQRPTSWSEERRQFAGLWTMTPGLAAVAAAADSLGAGREGVLGAVLPRVAASVPPNVRMVRWDGRRGLTSQGGSLNFYSALVGKPGSGKTVAMSAAEGLVPLPPSTLVPEGTAEGMVKCFAYMRREKTKVGDKEVIEYVHTVIAETAMMVADEIDGVLAEMIRQGTKFGPVWRSMWMGTMVGTTTGDVDRRTKLRPHSYRFSALLGCQPTATAPLWEQGDRGTPQRIMWLPVSRQRANGQPEPGPLSLAFQRPVSMLPDEATSDADAPVVWIDWAPAAVTHVKAEAAAAELTVDPYGEFDDDDDDDGLDTNHDTFHRLKIHAMLAIMDGLEKPTDTHWEAAGVIMAMRDACVRRTKARATRAGAVKAEKTGHLQGVQRASARRSEDEAAAEFTLDLSARINDVVASLGGTATGAAIIRLLSKKQKPHGRRMLMRMAGPDGPLRQDPATDKFSFAV